MGEQLLDDFIDITYEIRSEYSNSSLPANTSNWVLVYHTITSNVLLAELANKTGLTVEYINNTIKGAYASAKHIEEAYQYYKDLSENDRPLETAQTNATSCGGRMDNNNLIISAFVPAIIIIIILSCVSKRIWRKGCCGGHPGLAIPVNLLDSYEDRFIYSFAFAATASNIVSVVLLEDFAVVFGEEFRSVQGQYPSYLKAIFRILAAFVIGTSYYPFFACISTHQRLLGAILGTIYSTIWFMSYLFRIIDCAGDPNQEYGLVDDILLKGTSILFHGLLLLAFIRVLIRSLISNRRGMVVSQDEWKENYKYHYVQKLLKPIPKSNATLVDVNGLKQKVISNVYRWKPDFKYSTRIICIYITACACLYMVIIMYSIIGRWIKTYSNQVVDYFQENDEKSRRNSLSATESPTVEWERVREGIHVTIICWMVAIGGATIKDLAMMGNMLSWYRGHVVRLQKGDKSFLPYNIEDQAPVGIMVSSFKFAGYQAGYIIWSFIITQLVLFLIITAIALGFIWPLTWGGLKDAILPSLLVTLWPTILITLITIVVQQLMAKYLFLRDHGAMLALNNRRLFHIASYFFFFINIFVGLFSCLIRIFYAVFLGALFLPRLQKSALPRDWELFDPGYKTYIGYLFLEHTHTNPVIFTFNRLMWETIQNAGDQLSFNADETKELDIEMVHEVVPRRARVRWFLAVTLINNPDLVELRRRDIQEPEIKKDTCIKKFKMKVTQKIDAIKENHAAKHDSKL